MSDQLIVVPQISTLPGHEAKAGIILRWLTNRGVVEALPTRCGRGSGGMAYGIGPNARAVARHPERLPYGRPLHGMEIVYRRCVFMPERDFREEAGCPQCRREIGVPLFENLDEWSAGVSDNFTCPQCGFEDDINGFLFPQPCGFSNLGFIFNDWSAAGLRADFVDGLAERLGFAVRLVHVSL